jgi:hypothetical protein
MPLLRGQHVVVSPAVSPFTADASKFQYHTRGLFNDYLSSAYGI